MRISNFIKNRLYELVKLKSQISTKIFWSKRGRIIRNEILKYYERIPISNIDNEKKDVINFLKNNKVALMPYEFVNEYLGKNVTVYYDNENKHFFVYFDNKKLYYRKDWRAQKIKKYHLNLLAEQDYRSPHSYLEENFTFKSNETLVDVGAAEGIFSLMLVDRAKEIFVIEPDPLWIEALNLTFNPWKDKVRFIPNRINTKSSESEILMDEYFKNKVIDFIKVDIEGCETEFLESSKEILSRNHPIKIALATYHNQNDENEFSKVLVEDGFNVSYSTGYIIYYYDNNIDIPYLRRGLIRAQKFRP